MEVCKNDNKQICFSFNVIKEKAVLRLNKPSNLKSSSYGVISNMSLRQNKTTTLCYTVLPYFMQLAFQHIVVEK